MRPTSRKMKNFKEDETNFKEDEPNFKEDETNFKKEGLVESSGKY